jgi:hypothetical protein
MRTAKRSQQQAETPGLTDLWDSHIAWANQIVAIFTKVAIAVSVIAGTALVLTMLLILGIIRP